MCSAEEKKVVTNPCYRALSILAGFFCENKNFGCHFESLTFQILTNVFMKYSQI